MNVVEEHLAEAYSVAVEGNPRKRQLRVSSLPYCPILDVVLPREPELITFSASSYMTMGTHIHSIIQIFMSVGDYGKNVWGGWKCGECGKEYKKYCFRPDPCCGVPLTYVEVTFQVGPLSGHCDLICRYGKKWILYEFKTHGEKPEKPKAQHLLQIRTYAELLRIQYGIHISAYVVVYIGREHLAKTVFGPYSNNKSTAKTDAWLYRAIKGFKAATQARKDPSKVNLTQVVKARPCTCRASFDEYMGRAYEMQKSPCPMLTTCCRGDRAALKAMEEMVESRE